MTTARIGRNDPCRCGSGKKYKRCCLEKDEAARVARSTPAILAPSRASTAPAPRVKTDEDLRWEEFWDRYNAASVDAKLSMVTEVLDSEPAFDGELAWDLSEPLHRALESAGRYDDIDALFASIEHKHPVAFERNAGWFALWQAENELRASRGREIEAMRRLGRHFVDVIDAGNHFVGQLRFHGRVDCVEALLASAWPHVDASDDLMSWSKRKVAHLLAEAILVRHQAGGTERTPVGAGLVEELTPVLGVTEAARVIAQWATPRPRRWSFDDFAGVGNPEDTSLYELAVDFAFALQRRWGFHPLRAGMARASIHHMIEHGQERTKRSQWNEPRTIQVPPSASSPIAVVPSSAIAFARAHSDIVAMYVHELAAALLGMRHWGAFLAEHGLVDESSAKAAWARFLGDVQRELGPGLLSRFEGEHDSAAADEVRLLFSGGST